MALTDHYDLRYVDEDEEISDFPNMHNRNIDDIDAAIHNASTSDDVAASRVTGTLAAARIPNLSASKTTSGTFADARVPSTIARVEDMDSADDELSRLIGLNDEYVSDCLKRVGTLEDDVPALDKRVTALEDSDTGGGGGDGGSVFDSGVREVNDLFPGAVMYHPTNSLCSISRFGPMVTLTLASFDFDGSGNVKMGDIPEGFRPPSTLRFQALAQSDDPISCAVRGSQNDLYAYGVPEDAGGYTAHIVYRTPDPQPSDLPGNAV